METFELIAILITLAAVLSYINHRLLKLPRTIGLMLLTLLGCLTLIALDRTGLLAVEAKVAPLVSAIDFEKVLMEVMLGLLLFAGALHVNINDLLEHKWTIGILATVGVIASTFLIGAAIFALAKLLELDLPFIYCLLFGALISPTDPIAVLALLKKANAPKGIETKLAGESLFNDGIAVVIFIAILGITTGKLDGSPGEISLLFFKEVAGGLAFGLVTGGIAFLLLKSIDNYHVEILITLALVMGGYSLAHRLHISGPLAMVVAGLLIGNQGRRLAMSPRTVEHLDTFWELIDEILNSILFVLIGLEVLIMTLSGKYLLAGVIAIGICLLSRFLCVAIPISFLRRKKEFSPHAIRLLTWGGLRGGIAVALALALPQNEHREMILTMTYVVVVFSILVQGMTIKYLVKR